MSPKLIDWEGEWVPKISKIWMLARIEFRTKNLWIFRSIFEKNMKKAFPKKMFFSFAFFYRFWWGLGTNLEGFWEGFGASWSLLNRFFASLFGACIWHTLWKGSWSLLGSILARFGEIWEGSGEDLGSQICVFFRLW